MRGSGKFFRQRSTAAVFIFFFFLLFLTGTLPAPELEPDSLTVKLDPHLESFYYQDTSDTVVKPSRRYMEEQGLFKNGLIPVIVETAGTAAGLEEAGAVISSKTGDMVTCSIPPRALKGILSLSSVRYVHAVSIHKPMLDQAVPSIRLDKVRQTDSDLKGQGVLIGIYDTGIDWRHEDFIDENGKSRIRFIWDQTDDTGNAPSGFTYGREYRQDRINAELAGTASGTVQEKDLYGHGTHVASIAGGDGSSTGNGQPAFQFTGMAPLAEFIIVKGGDSSFYSNREIDGLNYMSTRAKQLGMPIVMNLSLGGHDGGHDGTDPPEIAIDEVSGAGSIVVVAAGNDGKRSIHLGHNFSSAASREFLLDIPVYSPNPGTNGGYNDYVLIDAWYSGSSLPAVTIRGPGGQVLGPVNPGIQRSGKGSDGEIAVNNGRNHSEGNYQIIITITDYSNGTEIVPRAGTWRITFSGSSGGEVDGWLYESSMGAGFANGSASYEKLVAIPGTATKAITVGAYKSKNIWIGFDGDKRYSDNTEVGDISSFSSQGPTRDGREKPEITAPGQEVTGAKAESYIANSAYVNPDGKHVTLRGTSMAAPVVTGIIALMFQNDPTMTPEAARQILRNGAKKDEYTGFLNWNKTWGYGKIDAKTTLDQVSHVNDNYRAGVPDEFELFQNFPNPFNAGTKIRYSIPKDSRISIAIYSITGSRVRDLAQTFQAAGTYTLFWDGRNNTGQQVASNIYLLRMEMGDIQKTIKMALLK